MPSSEADKPKPKCFIAMPITTRDDEVTLYGDPAHWEHVLETLFVRAVEMAGFEAVRPAARGAHMIHGEIIRNLSNADIVLCDLSGHNPNVFFELGVRTSVNKPIALVRDENTLLPFDTSGINTYAYDSHLSGWDIDRERDKLAKHITDCVESCNGENPLWRQFALTIKASEPVAQGSPQDAKIDLLLGRMDSLQHQMARERFERTRDLERERERERERVAFIGGPTSSARLFVEGHDFLPDAESAVSEFVDELMPILYELGIRAEIEATGPRTVVLKTLEHVVPATLRELARRTSGTDIEIALIAPDGWESHISPNDHGRVSTNLERDIQEIRRREGLVRKSPPSKGTQYS